MMTNFTSFFLGKQVMNTSTTGPEIRFNRKFNTKAINYER